MSEHLHTEFVPGCYRCELSGDELGVRTMTGFNPDWTVGPWATLREIIAERKWTVREVAERTGVSKSRVHQYLRGDQYPASWAVAFATTVGCSPQFIWNLQSTYLLDLALGRTDVTYVTEREQP